MLHSALAVEADALSLLPGMGHVIGSGQIRHGYVKTQSESKYGCLCHYFPKPPFLNILTHKKINKIAKTGSAEVPEDLILTLEWYRHQAKTYLI